MIKTNCHIWNWDEIECSFCQILTIPTEKDGDGEFDHELPQDASGDKIVKYLSELFGDKQTSDELDSEENGWRQINAIARSGNSAIVEWQDERGHLAVTTLIWH